MRRGFTIVAPANAFVYGSTWYCKNGYHQVNDHCELVVAPPNAFISGSGWSCKDGYKRFGDSCVKYNSPLNNWKY